mgnify:CR=1 FL=1
MLTTLVRVGCFNPSMITGILSRFTIREICCDVFTYPHTPKPSPVDLRCLRVDDSGSAAGRRAG